MFRPAFKMLLVGFTVHTLVLPVLAQMASISSEAKALYRIYYRNGSQGEWREAFEAGSPVESEDKAIELAKLVKEKFDEGRLVAFEIEIRKIKVFSRPATDEELHAHAQANTVSAPSIAGPTVIVTSRSPKPVAHALQNQTSTTTNRLPGAKDAANTQIAGVAQSSDPSSANNDSKNNKNNSVAPRTLADKSSEPSPELVMNDKSPRVTVQNNVRLVVRDGSPSQSTDTTALANSPQPGSSAALDALVTRLSREAQMPSSTLAAQPVTTVLPVLTPTSSLNPDFFDSPAAQPTRPQTARRIRVIRNGVEVTRRDYDGNGTRIEDPQSSNQPQSERPLDNAENKSGSQPPDGTLVFDEDAKRPESTVNADGKESEAAALQKDREALQARKADLERRQSLMEQETQRLNSERDAFAKEDQRLKGRVAELKARESRERKTAASSLIGCTGTGTYGSRPFTVEFLSKGQARVDDSSRTFDDGNWSQTGNTITIRVGDSTLTGTLSGNSISGGWSRTDGLNNGWRVTLSGSSPGSAEMRQKIAQDERQLEADQAAHDSKYSSHQQATERLQSGRRQFQSDQNQYESEFAKHHQQTIEFNSRQK